MKFTISIAVIALLSTSNAIRLRDEGDDMYTDDDSAETLKSIQAAEVLHGSKFNGIS